MCKGQEAWCAPDTETGLRVWVQHEDPIAGGPQQPWGGAGHLMAEAARVLGTLTWAPCGFPSAGQAESGRSHTLSGGGGA